MGKTPPFWTWRRCVACLATLGFAVSGCGAGTSTAAKSATSDDAATGQDGHLADGLNDGFGGDTAGKSDATDAIDGTAADIGDANGQELADSDNDGPCSECDTLDDAGETAINVGDADATGGCEFAANPLPGAPGSACNMASDCDNGLCIPNGNGKICTTTCSTCCPSGFACDFVTNGSDSLFMCVPKLYTLCNPCMADADCVGSSSKGALCVSYGDAGNFCGGACAEAKDCPTGYACQGATGQSGAGKQCVRTTGECTCSAEAVNSGAKTTCLQQNDLGACSGQRKCAASGLTACDAPLPATETCNGVDDDCDGKTDPPGAAGCTTWYVDGDADLFGGTDSQCLCAATGSYAATQSGDCNDGNNAVNPKAFDSCNGVDDNCNGVTDEAYGDLDGDGIADCVDGDMDGDGYANAADCSPTTAAIHPGATEICDGLDDDCNGVADEPGTSGCTAFFPDADGDGAGDKTAASTCLCAPNGLSTAVTATDCNDNDAAIKPGATEMCDGVDNDCNGQVDEGCDDDGDDWCDGTMGVVGQPPVCLLGAKDCNDLNAAQNPGAKETCGNAVDDNCDGVTDSGLGAVGCTLLFDDADGDGAGAGAGACLCAPEGLVTALTSDDCDDTNSAIKPGAAEVCGNGKDDNCNGLIDEAGGTGCAIWYTDADNDGYGAGTGACLCKADAEHPVANNKDCDDGAAGVSPAATETCNAIDDNCNSVTDEAGATGCTFLHADDDGDGFGAPAKSTCLCKPNADFPIANASDCNDAAIGINPAATETCNGIDDNCDGATDDVNALSCQIYYADADSDTWGNPALYLCLCNPLTVFTVKKAGDCNDVNAAMYPGKPEVCDGLDNNCDGTIDEPGAGGCKAMLRDHDGDGYGSVADPSQCLCAASGEYTVTVGGDCNDSDNKVHPLVAETCNGIDDDCDGTTDPVGAGGCSPWYVDQDGDGFGTYLQNSQCLCKAAAGFAPKGGDCNDAIASINPSAIDICNGIDDDCNGSADPKNATGCQVFYADGDADGYGVANLLQCTCVAEGAYSATVSGDCNDTTAAISPAVTETCNGVDDNCNNQTDEGLKALYYVDGDSDTWGTGPGLSLCASDGVHTALKNGDCNDAKAAINPAAAETCNGVDDNCDTQTDEGLPTTLWYKDGDSDSFGGAPGVQLCGALGAYTVSVGGDCNDANQSISPAAAESCNGIDDNCNNAIDEGAASGCTVFYRDADADGVGVATDSQCLCAKSGQYTTTVTGDCNDNNAAISPKALETCNGYDDNCDGLIDNPSSQGCTTYYVDADTDNYGSQIAPTQCLCTKLTGFATQAGDCNDFDGAINPLAAEVCNGKDDNCDGSVDPINSGACVTYYGDGDLDGYGGNLAQCACGPKNAFTALVAGDCNDLVFAINPGVTEVCNSVDDNCNSLVDEGLTNPFYVDIDGDGWGTGVPAMLCVANATFSASKAGDCDDTKGSINPGASEACNGIDDNCNTAVDEGLTFLSYYADADGDGYGNKDVSKSACSQPTGYVPNQLDCNDGSPAIKPGATEVCNGVDDNCNGAIDDGIATTTYYQDFDGDGYGNASASVAKCSPPIGYTTNALDCNDANAAIKPGATEVCNGVDDDCNGAVDNGNPGGGSTCTTGKVGVCSAGTTACSGGSVVCNQNIAASSETCNGLDDNCDGNVDEGVKTTYYQDGDGDSYGRSSVSVQACSQPTGYVTNSSDCNDGNNAIHPGATEVCNGADDDCNGTVDNGNPGGGVSCSTGKFGVCSAGTTACTAGAVVCNQNVAASGETCNGLDDNCDGSVDEGVKTTYYRDADGDTFGSASSTTQACTVPGGYVTTGTDCNDGNTAIHPGATETCNGIDDDCNGTIDNGNPGGGGSCTTGLAGVCSAGTNACSGGAIVCTQNVASSAETCNGLDDNCNGTVDEGVKTTYYLDGDSDTYGTSATSTQACSKPTNYVTNNTDCNDASAAIHPGAAETCNGADDNCNGTIDEGVKTTYYADTDGDTYGNPSSSTLACSKPTNYVTNNTDCNDGSAAIHPGAAEINCDGIDQDCSGADTCPCPTASVLNPLDSSSNIITYPGQWWFDSWIKTEGSNSLTWEVDRYTCGYNSGSDTATFNVAVPTGSLYVTADVFFNNVNDYGTDTTAVMTLNLGGSVITVGPYASSLAYVPKTVKWGPFTAANWGKTYVMSVTMTATSSTSNCDGGFSVDNIKSSCN